MRPVLVFLLLGSFAFPVLARSQGEGVAMPTYGQGDAFIFSNGRVERYNGQKGTQMDWRFLSGRHFGRDQNLFLPITSWSTSRARGHRHFNGHTAKLWPLRPGRKISFTAITDYQLRPPKGAWKDAKWRHSIQFWKCRVRSAQKITVAAGTFDTLPVRCQRYSAYDMRLLQKIDWYYAPAVGHYIRRDWFSYITGKRASFELLAALPGKSANPRRIRAILKAAKTNG